jgi:hypothetical protein
LILRLLRGCVTAANREAYLRFIREHAVGEALAIPGLLSFQPGLRRIGDGIDIVVITTWEDFGAIASLQVDLDRPVAIPGGAELIRHSASTHYELVSGTLRSMPLDGARIRILHGTLRPNREAAFFEWMRDQRERLLSDGLLVGGHLGRRMQGSDAEIAFVGTWRDEAAIDALTGGDVSRPIALGEETQAFFARGPEVETYDAITIAPGAATAPALLLFDDERRSIYSTPVAARLTGHSSADLASRRLDDIVPSTAVDAIPAIWSRLLADGGCEGTIVILDSHGSQREMRYVARRDTPWRGSHAWLLAAGTTPMPDLDSALADAGIVARYVAAGPPAGGAVSLA